MRLDYAKSEPLEMIGGGEKSNFSIKASAKAFRLLLDGLYSNKIRSIVREICTNAYDGHRMRGNTDRAFYVHAPSAFEPWFGVRDYGVSMDHDTVMHVYSTVFESTKDESNDAVGAFGLGSKTPFAYTEEFSVTCYMDGKARLYGAAIDSGIPVIALLAEQDSDEEQGVEVRFAVAMKDVQTFRQEIRSLAKGFDPVFDCAMDDLERLDTTSRIGAMLVVSNSGFHRASVKQGCVIYPIPETDQIMKCVPNDFQGREHVGTLLRSSTTLIECDIGEVEVAASREVIALTEHTCKNIARRMMESVVPMVEEIEAHFDECTNQLEALEAYYRLAKSPKWDLYSKIAAGMRWKGILYTQLSTMHTGDLSPCRAQIVDGPGVIRARPKKDRYSYNTYSSARLNLDRSTIFLVIDEDALPKRADARIEEWRDSEASFQSVVVIRVPSASFITPTKDQFQSDAEYATHLADVKAKAELKRSSGLAKLAALKEAMESMFSFVHLDELPEPPKVERVKSDFTSRKYHGNGWDRYHTDLPEEDETLYYVPLTFGIPVVNVNGCGEEVTKRIDLDAILAAMRSLGLTTLKTEDIHGINKSDIRRVKDWEERVNVITDLILPALDTARARDIQLHTTIKANIRSLEESDLWQNKDFYASVRGTTPTSPLIELMQPFHEAQAFLTDPKNKAYVAFWSEAKPIREAHGIEADEAEPNAFADCAAVKALERFVLDLYPMVTMLGANYRINRAGLVQFTTCLRTLDEDAAVVLQAAEQLVSLSDAAFAA